MLNKYSFTFDGIHVRDMGIRATGKKERSVLPPIEPITLDVPGRAGEYYHASKLRPRVFDVPLAYTGPTPEDTQELIRQIAAWLSPERGERELVFDDDPDRYYIAVVSGETHIDNRILISTNTVTFIAFDPIAYGTEEQEHPFTGNSLSLEVEGTTRTFPRFVVTFSEDSSFLKIVKNSSEDPDNPEFILLGVPEEAEVSRVPAERRVLTDNCDDLTAWSAADAVDGGQVMGSMKVTTNGFQVDSYGTWESGPNWHGPALKRSLPEAEELQNFKARIFLGQETPGAVGRVELYLLDINLDVIGKVALKDTRPSAHYNEPEARAGDLANGVYFHSTEHHALNDFYGVLEISRVGKTWKFYIARRHPDGSYSHRRTTFFYDEEGLFQNKLAAIQIHMGTIKNRTVLVQWIRYILVNEVNTDENVVEDIFQVGDELEIDCAAALVLLNGDNFMQRVDPVSYFFGLKPGNNSLSFAASGAATAIMYYKPRWV